MRRRTSSEPTVGLLAIVVCEAMDNFTVRFMSPPLLVPMSGIAMGMLRRVSSSRHTKLSSLLVSAPFPLAEDGIAGKGVRAASSTTGSSECVAVTAVMPSLACKGMDPEPAVCCADSKD